MKKKKQNLFTTLAAYICLFIITSCSTIKTQTYKLDTPLLSGNSEINIILISDLHNTIFGNNQIVLIDKIKKLNPDLVILSGDILDDEVPNSGAELLLSGIKDIAPIYYVTGNHEYYSNNIHIIRKLLHSYHVNILSDDYIKISVNNNELIIAGIEDPVKKIYETPEYNQIEIMEKVFNKLDEVKIFKILVAHRPENIENYKKYSFNLILSGHTHGGQARIPPVMNGLYAPNQGFFPKYAGGFYRHGEMIHIISRGLSVNPKLPRIFNPPELVIIIIGSAIIPVTDSL
jgi:predicted MPP superfamily phosphohydrolase